MNRVYGVLTDYAPVREDESRTIVSYGLTKVDKSHYEWYEVYIYKKQHPNVSVDEVKKAVLADIDARTDEKILCGFVWTPEGAEAGINVWLSAENQRNFSEAQRMAAANPNILPLTFKLGEDAEGLPVYHTFESAEELNAFYFSAFAYIKQCLDEGWAEKDAIDMSVYDRQP